MNKRITLWIVIGVLFLAALFLSFNAGSTVQAAGSAANSAASSYSGMVGGC